MNSAAPTAKIRQRERINPQNKDLVERNFALLEKKIAKLRNLHGRTQIDLIHLDFMIQNAKEEDKENQSTAARKEVLMYVEDSMPEIEKDIELERKDELFFERVEAGLIITDYLEKNPEADLTSLEPADFVKDPKLLAAIEANPDLWLDLTTESKKGFDILEVINSRNFGISDPKSRVALKRASKRDGQAILRAVKNNPHVVIGVALGAFGVWALLNKHYKTAITSLGVAGALGLTSYGYGLTQDFHRSLEKKFDFSKEQVDKVQEKLANLKNQKLVPEDHPDAQKESNQNIYDPESPAYDVYTKKVELIIAQKKSAAEAIYWVKLREYLKSSYRISFSGEDAKRYLTKLENLEGLTEADRDALWSSLLGNGFMVKTTAAGIGIVCFGASFFWEIYKKEAELAADFTRWITNNRRAADFNALATTFVEGAIYVGGIASVQEAARGVFGNGAHEFKIGRVLLRGAVAGASWPIYALEVGGRMVSTSARLARKTPLGYLQYTGKFLRIVDASGRVISEVLAARKIPLSERKLNAAQARREAMRLTPQEKMRAAMHQPGLTQAERMKLRKEAIATRAAEIRVKDPLISLAEARQQAVQELRSIGKKTRKVVTKLSQTINKVTAKLQPAIDNARASAEALKQYYNSTAKPVALQLLEATKNKYADLALEVTKAAELTGGWLDKTIMAKISTPVLTRLAVVGGSTIAAISSLPAEALMALFYSEGLNAGEDSISSRPYSESVEILTEEIRNSGLMPEVKQMLLTKIKFARPFRQIKLDSKDRGNVLPIFKKVRAEIVARNRKVLSKGPYLHLVPIPEFI